MKNYGLTLIEFLLAVTVMASGTATAIGPLAIQRSVEAIRMGIL
jgi:prepilin-type N-terminal cleavage/methylation domain-containing protein